MKFDKINNYIIDINFVTCEYGQSICEEFNELIMRHNASISDYGRGLSITALVNVLIEKGIFNEDEYISKIEECINAYPDNYDSIKHNYEQIMRYLEESKSMAEELENLQYTLDKHHPIDTNSSNN